MRNEMQKKVINPLDRFPLNIQQALRLLAAVALRRHAELRKEKERQTATCPEMTE